MRAPFDGHINPNRLHVPRKWKSAIYSIYLLGNLLNTPLGVWANFNNSYMWWYDTDSDTCIHSREDTRWTIEQTRRKCKLMVQIGKGKPDKRCTPITEVFTDDQSYLNSKFTVYTTSQINFIPPSPSMSSRYFSRREKNN